MRINAFHMRNIPVPALANPGSAGANTRSDARDLPCSTAAPNTELLDALGVQQQQHHHLLHLLRLELAGERDEHRPRHREQARCTREPAARRSASAAEP